MAILAGVGVSEHEDSYQAGYEACAIAMKQASIDKPDIIIVFTSYSFNQEQVLKGVREASGQAPLVGCSAAGEITNDGPRTRSVAVMAIKASDLSFITGQGGNIKSSAYEAGKAVAADVLKKTGDKDELSAFIIFPDVLSGNGADIVRGALSVLGDHFPLVGGAAGDDFRFEQTFQYHNETVLTESVVGLGISGRCVLGLGVRHGWVPIGIPKKVTKAQGSRLYELDGAPAISIYDEYFEEKADELRKETLARTAITYPLGLKVPDLDEYLIRDPLTVHDDGSITCAAEIPEGSEIRLMIGSRERAIEAAQDAARKLMKDFADSGAEPKLLLMFNCIAREKLFAQKAKDEINAVLDVVGNHIPLLGFYTYGEQAPLGGELQRKELIHSAFFNETIVIFAIGE